MQAVFGGGGATVTPGPTGTPPVSPGPSRHSSFAETNITVAPPSASLRTYSSLNRTGRVKGLLIEENVPAIMGKLNPQTYSITADETIELAGYGEHSIYHIKRKSDGAIVRVRKIEERTSGRAGQYNATLKEEAVYRTLTKTDDYSAHLFPFVDAVNDPTEGIILIDFTYMDGVTFEDYLMANPSEKKSLLRAAATHLKWLLENGYVHGDIKLDNFFVDKTGKTYVFDFGRSSNIISLQTVDADIARFLVMASTIDVELPPIATIKGMIPAISGIKRLTSNLSSAELTAAREENRERIKAHGSAMYDKIIELLSSHGGGSRRKHITRRMRRHRRRTYKSIPRMTR